MTVASRVFLPRQAAVLIFENEIRTSTLSQGKHHAARRSLSGVLDGMQVDDPGHHLCPCPKQPGMPVAGMRALTGALAAGAKRRSDASVSSPMVLSASSSSPERGRSPLYTSFTAPASRASSPVAAEKRRIWRSPAPNSGVTGLGVQAVTAGIDLQTQTLSMPATLTLQAQARHVRAMSVSLTPSPSDSPNVNAPIDFAKAPVHSVSTQEDLFAQSGKNLHGCQRAQGARAVLPKKCSQDASVLCPVTCKNIMLPDVGGASVHVLVAQCSSRSPSPTTPR